MVKRRGGDNSVGDRLQVQSIPMELSTIADQTKGVSRHQAALTLKGFSGNGAAIHLTEMGDHINQRQSVVKQNLFASPF